MNGKRTGRWAMIALVAALIIYVVMVAVTLPHLAELAGERVFDMRPRGYSEETARAIWTALGEEGRRYYLTRQLPLDAVFPGLMAVALVLGLRWMGQRGLAASWVCLGIIAAVGAALADYSENILVAIMLMGEVTQGVARAASMATVVKSVANTAAYVLVLLGLARVMIGRRA